jgi:hypothetical protein
MKKYINKYGLLSFSIDGKDYVSNMGDPLELPSDNSYVNNLLSKGYIVEENVKPQKPQK